MPVIKAITPERMTTGRLANRFRFASTNGNDPVLFNPCTISRPTIHAIRLIKADSIKNAIRSTPPGQPNTFCVLTLFMRSGVSAVLKFVKLMAATRIISKAIPTNKLVTSRLPLRNVPRPAFRSNSKYW